MYVASVNASSSPNLAISETGRLRLARALLALHLGPVWRGEILHSGYSRCEMGFLNTLDTTLLSFGSNAGPHS